MVYNHTPRGRTPLNLAISDDGEHWTPWRTLESDPGEYSYPAMIQSSTARSTSLIRGGGRRSSTSRSA